MISSDKPLTDLDAIDMDKVDETAIPANKEKKTEREQHLDYLETIQGINGISRWERGFCESCETWLNRSVLNSLSFKQKHVLDGLVEKYLG